MFRPVFAFLALVFLVPSVRAMTGVAVPNNQVIISVREQKLMLLQDGMLYLVLVL